MADFFFFEVDFLAFFLVLFFAGLLVELLLDAFFALEVSFLADFLDEEDAALEPDPLFAVEPVWFELVFLVLELPLVDFLLVDLDAEALAVEPPFLPLERQ